MSTVSVNPPKTPVTKGSSGIAAATMPNICKMPGPPAPFVPTPLPNIGKSDTSPTDYSTTVKIEGQPVAIAGATFGSMGDVASKGTGGGLISSNCEGPTKFVGPGSFDVKIEGKNVQLLGDPMLNNCGPGGSPPNAATMTGVLQPPGAMTFIYGDDEKCDNCGKTHPVPEGAEVGACLADVFGNLNEKYKKQKPAIDALQKLTEEMEDVDLNDNSPSGNVRLTRMAAARNILRRQLEADNVLRYDTIDGTFSNGYMVGAFICACRKDKKCLITTSGGSPPGFVSSTKGTGFTFVGNSFKPSPAQLAFIKKRQPNRQVWSCAAPKLIDAADGHKASQISERIFVPRAPGPGIKFTVTTLDAASKVVKTKSTWKQFEDGDKCPSCKICQNLLPAMLCKTKCN